MDDCDPAARLATRFPAKRAFITGAASGLGRALALEFARAGWRLSILDLSSEGVDPPAPNSRRREPGSFGITRLGRIGAFRLGIRCRLCRTHRRS